MKLGVWWWAIAALLGSGSLQAAPEPAYFLSRVTVLGGNPVRDVKDGVILERKNCRAQSARTKPLAGSLDANVQLVVEINTCSSPRPPQPPTVQCQIQVDKTVTPLPPFVGWQKELPFPLPSRVGVYGLRLECSIAGSQESLDSTLYVTYAPPREPVTPPREDWYRLACEWGAGLQSSVAESQVLERVLHRLHDHGQRSWRYGYCTIDEPWCRFGETSLPRTDSRLVCFPSQICRCQWRTLVQVDSNCNFTDCVGYSGMFQYIAGTLGVGGLTDRRVTGSSNVGFATNGWLRALDPLADGNLRCGYRDLPCSFVFAIHDLRQRHDKIYDATFGRTYLNLSGLISSSILRGPNPIVFDHMRACFLHTPSYGGFTTFRELPSPDEGCAEDDTRPAVFASAMEVELESTQGDEKPESIRVSLKVDVKIGGDYTVFGTLSSGDAIAVARSSFHITGVWPHAYISGRSHSQHTATLWFSGEDLVNSKVAGPYRVDAIIVSPRGISDEIRVPLPPALSFEGLGERAARLGEVAAERMEDPGGPVLRARVPVTVRDGGLFVMDARLFRDEQTLAYRGARSELSEGEHVLTVDFPAEGIAGLYDLSVELHALDSSTGDPLVMEDSLVTRVGPFTAAGSP